METHSAGIKACPLGLVLDSGMSSKGSVAREVFVIETPGFRFILRVAKGKGGAEFFVCRRGFVAQYCLDHLCEG